MGKQDGKKLNEEMKTKDPKVVKKELEKLFLKKVVYFTWDGGKHAGVVNKVLMEKTPVISFKVWYEEPKKRGTSGMDPNKHKAALSPRLVEMKGIWFKGGKQKVGAAGEYLIKP